MAECQLLHCFGPCNNNQQNKTRASQLSARAFQSMSSEEQDDVYNDLYGFEASLIDDTSEFVAAKIEELGEELNKLDAQVLKYYLRAVQYEEELGCEHYVTSDKFLLMFLRAEKFDCRLAARKLSVYFKEKCELFGAEKLACRIKQSDLTQEDKKALFSGALFFTGKTDMAGRPIILLRRQYVLQQNIASMKRVSFYLFQHVLEDNETAQKKGVVGIVYSMKERFSMSPSAIRNALPLIRMIMHAIPVWMAACQICHDDMRERLITNMILVVFPKHFRARFQEHFQKTHEECLCNLASYGIDPCALPDEGNFRLDELREYLARLQQMEEEKVLLLGNI